MKADRLLSILLLLQTRGQVSATELAERLEVSVRTIYRDVDALSAAGVPVWAERGRHGGINLLPGFRTDVTGLTGDEARALFVLSTQTSHEALGLGDALSSALRKVMAALPAPHRPAAERTSERILIDPARWMHPPAGTEALDDLQQAVLADRRVLLTYRHSGATGPSAYTVDPYGLVSKAGVWYLVADLDAAPRLFRVDRVLAVAVSDAPVRHRPGAGLASEWAVLRAQVERLPAGGVRLRTRVRRRSLDMLLRIHGPRVGDLSATGDPDWAELTLTFPTVAAARAVLPYGADLEILSPPEARTELLRAAREVAELYG
ncbi:helix-turn-helix transcriptional regulator [Kitasatospora sp. NPDC058965]|uniref:helix-turn-helix transcriptional regulator n=1 Tax=Kitasatospora sp. NPDC058965 TaxID=3346682 RepID=UPI0036927BBF